MNWAAAAEALYENVGDEFLPTKLRPLLENRGRAFSVACSGGADSVFLALWASVFFRRGDPQAQLKILHFNHQLRGEASDADEALVVSLAEGLGLKVVVGKWVRDEKRVTEDSARGARMDFFGRASQASFNPLILTAHHAGDVVESVLMRLSRGSGIQGLSAPRAISEGLYGLHFGRPLLRLSKRTLIDELKSVGAEWREDASNESDVFYRNRVRSQVVPAWQEACERDLEGVVGRSREQMEEDFEALQEWADDWWSNLAAANGSIRSEDLARAPRAVQRRLIIRFVREFTDDSAVLSPELAERFLTALQTREEFSASLSSGYYLVLEKGAIRINRDHILRNWDAFRMPLGTEAFLPNGYRIRMNWVELNKDLLKAILNGDIAHDQRIFAGVSRKHARSLFVRRWRDGDAYHAFGRGSQTKIKKLFNDRKLPIVWRRESPLFETAEGEILWMPGLPVNARYLLASEATHALQLTYEK
ncbi:MAG: tRNA lysidine(34) synthetase TilS [Verrucomicrobiota bacterium]